MGFVGAPSGHPLLLLAYHDLGVEGPGRYQSSTLFTIFGQSGYGSLKRGDLDESTSGLAPNRVPCFQGARLSNAPCFPKRPSLHQPLSMAAA